MQKEPRRVSYIIKVCSSGLFGFGWGQGELVLEALLICIFGAGQPRSYRGRTAEPVCGGLTEVKVLHCMRHFPNCQPFTAKVKSVCVLRLYLNVELGEWGESQWSLLLLFIWINTSDLTAHVLLPCEVCFSKQFNRECCCQKPVTVTHVS